MTELDLRRLLNNLETSRASLHGWLHFWTLLVVVGVALEVISLVWEYVKELNDFKRGEIHAPEKPSLVLFTVGFLGIALVVAGVSGELYIDVRAETIETGIRKANDDLLALISKEARDAETSAEGAADAASIAKARADEADIAAGKAQHKVGEVGKQADDLLKKYVAAEKELEATFMRTRPRMIHDNKFQEALRGKPKAAVEILFKPGDEEAWYLATQLKAQLTGVVAGWNVSMVRPLEESDALSDPQLNRPEVPLAIKSGAWWGLGLVVRSPQSAPYPCFDHEQDAAVCALQSALMQSGVGGGQIGFDPRMPDSAIKIIIGQEESGH